MCLRLVSVSVSVPVSVSVAGRCAYLVGGFQSHDFGAMGDDGGLEKSSPLQIFFDKLAMRKLLPRSPSLPPSLPLCGSLLRACAIPRSLVYPF
jgi:hypothetical protein